MHSRILAISTGWKCDAGRPAPRAVRRGWSQPDVGDQRGDEQDGGQNSSR